MNRDLEVLQRWASEKARTDDDHQARPLWAQIAREVEAYDAEPPEATGPDLFGEPA